MVLTPAGWRAIALALVIAAAAAVASTARVFSATVDEPAHLAAGLQWLTTGQYTYDLQHPPLGRIAIAAGAFVSGARSTGAPAIYDEGARILGTDDRYVDTLAWARRGVLAFFLLLSLGVWLWARRIIGETGAAVAILLLVTNPNVLAHAGLATTDVACAATTVLALYAAVRWAQEPVFARAVLFGIAMGAAFGSRLSAVAFVGGPLLVAYLLRVLAEKRWTIGERASAMFAQLATAAAAAVVVVLALYRFHPAPFVDGMRTFLLHGGSGHPTFLLGTPSNRGWWYYFPVALLVKTPLPLLLLSLVGAAAVVRDLRGRRDWAAAVPLASALTIVAISLTVKVDLGVRLVLPVYPLLAIVAAQGALALWRGVAAESSRRAAPESSLGAAAESSRGAAATRDLPSLMRANRFLAEPALSAANGLGMTSSGRMIVVTLLGASAAIAVRAHPDHLAYFNPLVGDHPERVLVDSNLDWGQDLYRLRDTLRARGVRDSVRIAYFGTSSPAAAGVPNARFLGLHERPAGWVAASETYLAGEWVGGAYAWLLEHPPVARIGPGMRLWYIAPTGADTTRDSSPR